MSGLWRLVMVYAVGVALVCLGLYGLIDAWVREQDETATLAEIERVAALLVEEIEPGASDIASGMPAAISGSPYRVTLIDARGRLLYDSILDRSEISQLESLAERPEIARASQEGLGSAIRFSDSLGVRMAYAAVQAPRGGLILRLGREYVPNRQLESRLQRGFALAALVLLAGLLGLAFLTNSRWKRSQELLTRWSGRIASGEFPQRLPLGSNRPMGPVARSLENLAAKTRTRIEGLEAERDHLSTVLSSMLEGVLVVDKRGRISDCNPAFREIFRIQRPPKGKLPLEVIRVASVAEQIAAVLKTGEGAWDEIKSHSRVLRVHFNPVGLDPPTGVVVVFNDISDLRRLEQLRKEFVSNVSHELKTPLTAIQGYAETLSEEPRIDPLHHQFLERIVRNTRQLSSMIDQLLNLARIESQSQELALEELDFLEIVGQLQEEFREVLSTKQLDFSWSAPEDSSFIADRSYIYQVFRNLLENATKYTQKGKISIRMEKGDGHWQFVVEDTGIGIPQEDLERIFERFYRVHKDRSRETGGSGIGLAIVKHIVEIHRGEVWAESGLNEGTRFSFTLPFPS